jgi:hypothetical protein
MKKDPHIRGYADQPPLIPGLRMRFRWPDWYDENVVQIRTKMQENGRGMFVLKTPQGDNALVEAYYPIDIQASYCAHLDPIRLADFADGKLIVVGDDLGPARRPLRWSGRLEDSIITAMRRCNRNARSDLKRQVNPTYTKLELEDRMAQDEAAAFSRFADFYEQAMTDTVKYAMTPHVGPGRSLSLGGQ